MQRPLAIIVIMDRSTTTSITSCLPGRTWSPPSPAACKSLSLATCLPRTPRRGAPSNQRVLRSSVMPLFWPLPVTSTAARPRRSCRSGGRQSCQQSRPSPATTVTTRSSGLRPTTVSPSEPCSRSCTTVQPGSLDCTLKLPNCMQLPISVTVTVRVTVRVAVRDSQSWMSCTVAAATKLQSELTKP